MVDRGNRERGLKAAIHNPRVSEKAKQRDREILETEFGEHFEGSSGQNITVEQPLSPEVSPDMDEEYIEEPEEQPTTMQAKQTSGLGSSMSESTTASSKIGKTRRSSTGAAIGSSTAHDIEGKDSGNV